MTANPTISDPASARQAGACCVASSQVAKETAAIEVSAPCCGTAAEAKAAGSCCGTSAKADAVESGSCGCS